MQTGSVNACPCKGRAELSAEHVLRGKAHHCCRPDVSPLTARPSEQQNLPLLGAQQGKSCDKVTSTRETLSQDWGIEQKKPANR